MKYLIAAILAAVALAASTAAVAATGGNPEFNSLSTSIAGRSSAILCVEPDEDPNLANAWGYTYLFWDFAVVDSDLCDALSLELYGKPSVHSPAPKRASAGAHRFGAVKRERGYAPEFGTEWKVANAVLVIAHESFHVREWDLRASESAVECRAIRHAVSSSLMLGFSIERARELLPWQLAFHWRIGVLAKQYASPNCAVPWPY